MKRYINVVFQDYSREYTYQCPRSYKIKEKDQVVVLTPTGTYKVVTVTKVFDSGYKPKLGINYKTIHGIVNVVNKE